MALYGIAAAVIGLAAAWLTLAPVIGAVLELAAWLG